MEASVGKGVQGGMLDPAPKDEELGQLHAEARCRMYATRKENLADSVCCEMRLCNRRQPGQAPDKSASWPQVESASERVHAYRATVPAFLSEQLQSQLANCRPRDDVGDTGQYVTLITA